MAVCLVTGGAGFLGSHLVEALVARGDAVRVLDNFSTGSRENLARVSHRVEVYPADVGDRAVLRLALQGVEVVFHLAAPAHLPVEPFDPTAEGCTCATDTLRVLAAAREAGVRRVVFASSGSVYGRPGGPRVTEADPTLPLSRSGLSKLAAERHCVAFTLHYGLQTVRLRYFDVFGPRQPAAGPYARALPALVRAVLAGLAPVRVGDALDHQDLLYVDDAVYAALLAADTRRAAGKVYNIGRGRPTTLAHLAAALNDVLGTPVQLLSPDAGPAQWLPRSVDINRAESELGFCPVADLRRELLRCVEYYSRQVGPGPAPGLTHAPGQRPHFAGLVAGRPAAGLALDAPGVGD